MIAEKDTMTVKIPKVPRTYNKSRKRLGHSWRGVLFAGFDSLVAQDKRITGKGKGAGSETVR